MGEDEKLFRIGIFMLISVVVITVALQVCYRTQNEERRRVRNDIVQKQQEIARFQANFASQVRPESLRNLVSGVLPHAEAISFNKSVGVDELPDRVNDK